MGAESVKLDHLRYFIAAVETGSFAAAGERLNITPTSIAHGISALEDALDNNFLIRKRAAGVLPTQEGQRLLIACHKILSEVDIMANEFHSLPGRLTGELIVGCQEGITWSIAPRVIGILSKIHPDLRVSVKTIFMDDELQPLENGDVDLLLTFMASRIQPNFHDKIDSGHFHKRILCSPQPYALMHAGHELCTKDREKVWLKELVAFPHIFIKDGPAYPMFYRMYEEIGLVPNVATVSNISPAAQSIVGQTEAVSLRIVRPSIDRSPLGDRLGFLELADKVSGPDVVAITHKNNHSDMSRKAKAFIDACQESFDNGSLKENFYY